jgi:hypothetical protein
MSVSRTPGSPTSLVQGETAAQRRAIKDATVANGAPSAGTSGFNTQNKRFLHIEVYAKDGTSVTWRLWTRRPGMSDKWCLDTRVGSSPTYDATVTAAAADNPSVSLLEIDGWDRVYVELLTFTGVFTTGVDVWIGTSGEGER